MANPTRFGDLARTNDRAGRYGPELPVFFLGSLEGSGARREGFSL
jgi:hypothetical protein